MQNSFDLLTFLKDWGPVTLSLIAVISAAISAIILVINNFSSHARKKKQIELSDGFQKLAADTLEFQQKADERYEAEKKKREEEIARLEKKVVNMEKIIAALGEDKIKLLAKIAVLEGNQEEMQRTISTLQDEKSMLEVKSAALEDRVRKLEAYIIEKGLPLPVGSGAHI